MVSADRTSRRQLQTADAGRRLSCVLEKGSCHISLFCLSVHLPSRRSEGKARAKLNRQEKVKSSFSAFRVQLRSGRLDTVILMLSEVWWGNCRPYERSVTNKKKSRQSTKDSRTDWCHQRSNIRWLTLFKMLCSGNNKGKKATSVGLSFNRSLLSRSWYWSLEIPDCAALYSDVSPAEALWMRD